MPRFLNTRGLTSIAVAICDRCRVKRPYSSMMPDPNFPGLRVCDQGCADQKDPYRLPARPTEKIALRFPRPDVSVATDPNDLTTGDYGGYVISTEQGENDGNLDGLEVTP